MKNVPIESLRGAKRRGNPHLPSFLFFIYRYSYQTRGGSLPDAENVVVRSELCEGALCAACASFNVVLSGRPLFLLVQEKLQKNTPKGGKVEQPFGHCSHFPPFGIPSFMETNETHASRLLQMRSKGTALRSPI